jgi:hypothetical protein
MQAERIVTEKKEFGTGRFSLLITLVLELYFFSEA